MAIGRGWANRPIHPGSPPPPNHVVTPGLVASSGAASALTPSKILAPLLPERCDAQGERGPAVLHSPGSPMAPAHEISSINWALSRAPLSALGEGVGAGPWRREALGSRTEGPSWRAGGEVRPGAGGMSDYSRRSRGAVLLAVSMTLATSSTESVAPLLSQSEMTATMLPRAISLA